ncbi:unnamed protein product, partial [Oppiella nova]
MYWIALIVCMLYLSHHTLCETDKGPMIIPHWQILLYNDSFKCEYTNDQKVDLYCSYPRTNYTTLYSIKMYKNTTLLYSIDMTNNNGTGCLSTSTARQMDSTIRLNQDHVVITIPHPTDTTMGNYLCQFNYLDITHNSQIIYSSLLNICNKKSCTGVHIRESIISPYTGKQDYNHAQTGVPR